MGLARPAGAGRKTSSSNIRLGIKASAKAADISREMRMARAFIASVPLGIVLVAALVVPLAVIPGTFGFQSWPSSGGGQVTERQVRVDPPRVAAVPVRPSRAQETTRKVASVASAPTSSPAVTAPTQARHAAATHVSALPARPTPSGPRPSSPPPSPGPPAQQPGRPSPVQQQPQQPASEPEPAPELVAGEHAPVARQNPAAQPAAPPPPSPMVELPAPEPVHRSAVPCDEQGRGGGGEHGDWGDEQGDDEQGQ
jgi:hypothetical protein